jgi:hypothetical protein
VKAFALTGSRKGRFREEYTGQGKTSIFETPAEIDEEIHALCEAMIATEQ